MANEQITRWVGSAATVLVVGWIGAAAIAAPIGVTLEERTFSDLLPGTEVPASLWLETNMSDGNLKAKVISQAFKDEFDNYAYLYQVVNTGDATNNVVEYFTCYPFLGAEASSSTIGYLIVETPKDFMLGDQPPLGANVDAVSGPTISFAFPGPLPPLVIDSYAIDPGDPGEASVTLFVLSDYPSGLITGNVINGEIGAGDVVGPVPEPTTISLLCLGAALVASRRRRR